MEADRKATLLSDILQLEETHRDAIIRAQEERYRKLRDLIAKLMTETSRKKLRHAPAASPAPAGSGSGE